MVNSDSLSGDETGALELLLDEFPYSQAIHNLVARGSQLNDLDNKQDKLNKAAVYATDRSILKAIITAPAVERKSSEKDLPLPTPGTVEKVEKKQTSQMPIAVKSNPPTEKIEEHVIHEKPEKQPPVQPIATTKEEFAPSQLSGDELLDELFQDLDKLKKLKHRFEEASANFDQAAFYEQPVIEKREEPHEASKPNTAGKGIIAEIKSTKKRIKPSDPKQKEQLEIIDRFIKSKPSIGKSKPGTSASEATDLSESSSAFTDNIVSETLVEILIKQGKKEKAVEVLRKLIWKFPQKKAYFAAQIEELTK